MWGCALTVRGYGYAPKGQRVDGLVSGHRRPRPSLIAARIDGRLTEPCLFEGTCDTAQLIAATGATLLFLAPYSPDLNPSEHDFAALKKRREYHDQATRDDIVKAYH